MGRHDMLRQARILQALADTDVPVPVVRAVDEVEPAWFAMELVAGESLEPVLDDPPVEPALAAARMRRAAEVLPRLHAVPLATLPVDGPAAHPPTSWRAGPGPWTPSRPSWCPRAGRLQERLAATCPAAIAPVWSTATTGWATSSASAPSRSP